MDTNTPTADQLRRIRRMVAIAMRAQDDFAVRFIYRDKAGRRTRRTVSPVRFIGQDQFSALCLCREEVRQFVLERCSDVLLVHANDVLMPVEIETLEPEETDK